MNIVGITGSLRRDSFNTRLLKAAARALPGGCDFQMRHCDLPLFSEDVERQGVPEPVQAFKQAITDADALLIATPEYNQSVSGVLKNAIDWASRPPFQSPLVGKRIGLLSASLSPMGANIAQSHLRVILAGVRAEVFVGGQFCLPTAANAFNDDGTLANDATREQLQGFVDGFVGWVER